MSQHAQTNQGNRGAVALLALLLLPSLALAQAAEPAPSEPSTVAAASGGRDVMVAVHAPEDITGAELKARLKLALEREGLGYGEISVTPISQDDYESFAKILEGDDSVAPCDDLVTRSQKSRYWAVRLPDGYSTIDHMDVTYTLRNDPSAAAKTEKIEPVSETRRRAQCQCAIGLSRPGVPAVGVPPRPQLGVAKV